MSEPVRSRSAAFAVDAPVDRVFGLFTAEGERAWVPGWDPCILSGRGERGSAFRTVRDGRTTTWVVAHFDAGAHRATYARLAEGADIGLVDVACDADGPARTRVEVRYTLTALEPADAARVEAFLDADAFTRFIAGWADGVAASLARA